MDCGRRHDFIPIWSPMSVLALLGGTIQKCDGSLSRSQLKDLLFRSPFYLIPQRNLGSGGLGFPMRLTRAWYSRAQKTPVFVDLGLIGSLALPSAEGCRITAHDLLQTTLHQGLRAPWLNCGTEPGALRKHVARTAVVWPCCQICCSAAWAKSLPCPWAFQLATHAQLDTCVLFNVCCAHFGCCPLLRPGTFSLSAHRASIISVTTPLPPTYRQRPALCRCLFNISS